MKIGKVFALTAVAVMALGLPLTALAESGSLSGEGEVEDIVDTDVFIVELPTIADPDSDTTFDFILDPQELLKASGNDAYASGTFALGGHMYFLSAADTYTSNTKTMKATNKSTAAVDLTVKAELKDHEGIDIVPKASVADATDPSMYMAIGMPATDVATVDTSADTMTAMTTVSGVTSATATQSIPAVTDNYEIKYVTDHYEMQEISSPAPYKSQYFYLDGAINTTTVAAEWKNLKIAQPTVEVTWEIKTPFAPKAKMDSTGKVVITGLTSAANVTGGESIKVKDKAYGELTIASGAFAWLTDDAAWDWDATNGGTVVLQLPAAYVDNYKAQNSGAGEMVMFSITLTDDSTISSTEVIK